MKVIQIYNDYTSPYGGEYYVVKNIIKILKKHDINTKLVFRSSKDLQKSLIRKVQAFWSGIYNPFAYKLILKVLKKEEPDVVHVHNLHPLFSPSILVASRKMGIPIVMTVHNYNLTCPSWYHLYKGEICERCLNGHEYWCLLRNCTGNIFKSLGYTLRSMFARIFHLFKDNVTLFIALTQFSKIRLINAGFDEHKVVVLPNNVTIPDLSTDCSSGHYVAFAGRISPEKGIDTLISAAVLNKISLSIAGDIKSMQKIVKETPSNIAFTGQLTHREMSSFYEKARFFIHPSKSFDMCPLVILEAMSHGLPVIASRIGGLTEIVDDGITGLLFEPGNTKDLASKMNLLWENKDLCRKMGKAARKKAVKEYNEDVYYKRLMDVYKEAIAINKEQKQQKCKFL